MSVLHSLGYLTEFSERKWQELHSAMQDIITFVDNNFNPAEDDDNSDMDDPSELVQISELEAEDEWSNGHSGCFKLVCISPLSLLSTRVEHVCLALFSLMCCLLTTVGFLYGIVLMTALLYVEYIY